MAERLPAHLEAMGIIRRAQVEGGFAAVLRKGDPDRGALTLLLRERGEFRGVLERVMAADFEYQWSFTESDESPDSEQLDRLVAARSRLDTDFWLIELDVADAERFVAETTGSA